MSEVSPILPYYAFPEGPGNIGTWCHRADIDSIKPGGTGRHFILRGCWHRFRLSEFALF